MDRRSHHGPHQCLRLLLHGRALQEAHQRGHWPAQGRPAEGARREGPPRAAPLLPHHDEQASRTGLPLFRRPLCRCPQDCRRRHRAAEKQSPPEEGREEPPAAARPVGREARPGGGRECHQDDDRGWRLQFAEGAARGAAARRPAGSHPAPIRRLPAGLCPWLRGRHRAELRRRDRGAFALRDAPGRRTHR